MKLLPAFAIVGALVGSAASAQVAGTSVIDNGEVGVRDLTLAPGAVAAPTPADADAVILYLGAARVRTVGSDGKARVVARRFGDAVFVPRGSGLVDSAVGAAPVHEAVVTLRDHIPAQLPNVGGLPLAFPRPGAIKRLDNNRVTVWNYSWQPGRPTPMHFHDKDVVVAFRYDGQVDSTTADGAVTVNRYKAGEIRLTKANRTHTELLKSARESAVMIELKR